MIEITSIFFFFSFLFIHNREGEAAVSDDHNHSLFPSMRGFLSESRQHLRGLAKNRMPRDLEDSMRKEESGQDFIAPTADSFLLRSNSLIQEIERRILDETNAMIESFIVQIRNELFKGRLRRSSEEGNEMSLGFHPNVSAGDRQESIDSTRSDVERNESSAGRSDPTTL